MFPRRPTVQCQIYTLKQPVVAYYGATVIKKMDHVAMYYH